MSALTRVITTPAALALPSLLTAQASWTQVVPPSSPGGRYYHAMAFDSARARTVLFGGRWNGNFVTPWSDTWEWDGTTWTERFPGTVPPARSFHGMAYDSTRGKTVLFGGAGGGPPGILADTWEFDGNDWIQRSRPSGPTARASHAMAYDSARHRVVMFGGYAYAGRLSDTWEWDGTAWIQSFPAGIPPARENHAMAFDAVRSRVVLFGGNGDGPGGWQMLADTWEWDGTDWSRRFPATSPAPRQVHAMAFDSRRAKVVLFGGVSGYAVPPPACSETWEYDGVHWIQWTPAPSPPPSSGSCREGLALVYDSARGRAVLFGGGTGQGPFADTWEYVHIPSAATYSTFGSGCTGNAGIPTLSAVAGQVPRLGERFSLQVANVPPAHPVFVLLGFSRTSWMGQFNLPLDLGPAGMPGCTLYASGELVAVAVSLTSTVTWGASIPPAADLVGFHFYNQGLVYDPGANTFGLSASNAGEAVIGER